MGNKKAEPRRVDETDLLRIERGLAEGLANHREKNPYAEGAIAHMAVTEIPRLIAEIRRLMPADVTKPRYAHDCILCRFLGQMGKSDLYFHCNYDDGLEQPTVIARHGETPNDYSALPADYALLVGPDHPLTEAVRRAEENGWLRRPKAAGSSTAAR